MQRYAVAFGAGCASAFLFAVSAEASPLAMALAYLAPLPIMIATLGWGLGAGALSAIASAVGLAVIAEPMSALLYAGSLALPAWLLPAFAVTPLARYLPARMASLATYPSVGAIVALAAGIAMIGAAAVLTVVIVTFHGYAAGAEAATRMLAGVANEAFAGEDVDAKSFADALVRIGPAAIAASTTLMLCVNLYAAARSVQLSHRLPRPWADLPSSLSLPAPLAVISVIAAGLAWALPPPGSQYAGVVAGGLGAAFVFQGLATAHALSRGLKLRIVMLVALYACCVLRAQYILPVVALTGVADALVRLRARAAALPPQRSTLQKK